ncbi:MAG: hypothetical protein AB4042_17955, partial [Leptolyngbyaceae cyanobacterium]
ASTTLLLTRVGLTLGVLSSAIYFCLPHLTAISHVQVYETEIPLIETEADCEGAANSERVWADDACWDSGQVLR